MFTDMALIAYTGSDGLDVVVRSLKTAKTMARRPRGPGRASNGEDLAEATTDAAGRVRFAQPAAEGRGRARRPRC